MTCALTRTLRVTAGLGEEVEVTAYAGHVVVEVAEGGEALNAHLTIEQARQHVQHMQMQIAAAERMCAGSIIRRLRLVTQEK